MFMIGGRSPLNCRKQAVVPKMNTTMQGEESSEEIMEIDGNNTQQQKVGQAAGSNQPPTAADCATADRSGILRYFQVVDKKRKRSQANGAPNVNKSWPSGVAKKNRFDPVTTFTYVKGVQTLWHCH